MVKRLSNCLAMGLALPAMLLAAERASAQTPACDELEPEERAAMAAFFKRAKAYGCCQDTFTQCLASPAPCAQTVRVASQLCRLARLGNDVEDIERELELRRKSMSPGGTPAPIALEGLQPAGDPNAKVTAVLYVCSRCPFCRDTVLALHREVTEDSLKGKVKLYLKPFPLKSHEGAVEGDAALVASARMGKGWPFALFLFKHFGEFHPSVLPDWAEFAGLDRTAFEAMLADEKTRQMLTESRKEGLRNKVEATPTLFINGRLYQASLESGAVVDALLEEWERVTESSPAKK